jgi:hypothetical protein
LSAAAVQWIVVAATTGKKMGQRKAQVAQKKRPLSRRGKKEPYLMLYIGVAAYPRLRRKSPL